MSIWIYTQRDDSIQNYKFSATHVMYLAHVFLGFTFCSVATADRTVPASPAKVACTIMALII
jgi:hypothetical protein